jgi:hypothetical protein
MSIPSAFLRHWGRLLDSKSLVHHASTRYRAVDWRARLTLPVDLTWSEAGFSTNKLGYLAKKYPLEALPPDGCIASARDQRVLYRRVDLTKGWMADVLYLQHLGWSGPVVFECPGRTATIHAVRLSCLFPVIVREGFFVGVRPNLRKTLKRAIVHRLERRYETYGQAKRANDWAHRIASTDDMRAAIDLLS